MSTPAPARRFVAGFLRVGIMAREREAPRRFAWITAGPGGFSIGVARAGGPGTRYTYRPDGGFYRATASQGPAGAKESLELVARHPPMQEVRGLLQLLSIDSGAGDRLRNFPFKRKFEQVFVRPLDGRASLRVGLLEPGRPEALDSIKRRDGTSGSSPGRSPGCSCGTHRASRPP
jgi:hypothetical protein